MNNWVSLISILEHPPYGLYWNTHNVRGRYGVYVAIFHAVKRHVWDSVTATTTERPRNGHDVATSHFTAADPGFVKGRGELNACAEPIIGDDLKRPKGGGRRWIRHCFISRKYPCMAPAGQLSVKEWPWHRIIYLCQTQIGETPCLA